MFKVLLFLPCSGWCLNWRPESGPAAQNYVQKIDRNALPSPLAGNAALSRLQTTCPITTCTVLLKVLFIALYGTDHAG
jgi:hypothetical protein